MSNEKEKVRFRKAGEKITKKINPKAWMGYHHIESSAQFIKDEAKNMFVITPPDPDLIESYNETIEKFGLTPEALKKKKCFFLGMTIFFVVLALVALGYTFYQGIAGYYRSVVPSFVLSLLCLALAFRNHFWYFQLKVKRLGCTLQDWVDYVLSGKKP